MDVTTTENMALTAQQKVRRKKMGIPLLASGMMIAIGVFASGRHSNLILENVSETYAGRCAFVKGFKAFCPGSNPTNPLPADAPVGSYHATCKAEVIEDFIEITDSGYSGTSSVGGTLSKRCPIDIIYKRTSAPPYWEAVTKITLEVILNTTTPCVPYINAIVEVPGEVCPKWKE